MDRLNAWRAAVVLSATIAIFGGRAPGEVAAQDAGAMPRISVSADKTSFVAGDAKRSFAPWGFNYLGRFEQLAEDDWETEEGWQRIETDFAQMKRLGANVVRWHLQFETFMEAAETSGECKPRPAALARLKKLLAVARKNELYLDLTGLNCFRKDRIPAWYDELSEANRWKAQAQFWEAIAKTCAGDSAVFCYDLMNEPIIGEPKAGEHPWVAGELGGFHFVQRISNKPAGRESSAIAEAWVKTLVTAIRKHDSETLVTVGVIPWAFVWANAKPIFYAPAAAKHLDFASIHIYPKSGEQEKELAALAVYDLAMPLVIEEIYAMNCSVKELDQFMEEAKPKVDGWISHYFGYTAKEHRAEGTLTGALKAEFLDFWTKKGEATKPPQ